MYKINRVVSLLLMLSLVGGFLPAGQAGLSLVLAEEETSNPYGAVRLSRLSLIEGEVLVQRGDDEEWVAASVNMPLRPHDKLWATDGARAEVQFDDGTVVRLAENTNLDLLGLEPGWTQLQLTLGVANFIAHSASRGRRDEAFFEVDTPQAAIRANRSTKFRVDVAEDGSTEITVREGKVELSSDQEPIVVAKNQRVVIEGGESPRYLLESAQGRDEWDRWNEEQDSRLAQSRGSEHLSPNIAMAATELDAYGQWTEVPAYGWVWAPQVPLGWVPYQTGRWVWVEPWGWTWVSYEPWGWVPYHYGRWVVVATVGWVWVPPAPTLAVWAPGYVRFIYGPGWVAWVPLAPGEVYYYNPGVSVRIDVNLINYRVPGAVVVVSRRTFVTGVSPGRRFIPPRDPIRVGRVVAGSPPVVPTRESLRPAPHRVVRVSDLPPRVIQRPVVYHRPASPPPAPFERRIKELREVVKQGRPPIVATPRAGPPHPPQAEEKRTPRVEDRDGSQKIHKDIMVRETIKEPARGAPRRSTPGGLTPPTPPTEKREPRQPDRQAGQPVPHLQDRGQSSPPERKTGQPHPPKQFELGKKDGRQPETARPLYREPPKPEKRQQPASPEKQGRSGEKPGEKQRGSGER